MTKEEAINYLQQIYPQGGHCWLDEQRIEAIRMAIKALKEEHVSNDFEMALAEMIDKAQKNVVEPLVVAAQWKDELIKLAKSEEPVSKGLEEAATKYAEKKCFLENAVYTDGELLMAKAKQRFDYYNIATAFEDGANWQKQQDAIPAKDLEELISTLSKRYPEVSFAKLSRIAVKVAKWQKQKMMKDAVEGVVTDERSYNTYEVDEIDITVDYDIDTTPFVTGDKVKLIIIKEDK